MSKQSTAGLVKYVKFLVEAGAMKRPVWLNALERVPPPDLSRAGRRPPTLNFPEDQLVRQYYRRHPEAKLEPLDLSSFEPSSARRFAARQLELMEAGTPRRKAREQAEADMAAAAAAAAAASPSGPRATVLEVVQREEEAQLTEALKRYTDHHGDQPPPIAAPAAMQGGPGNGFQRPQQRPWQRPSYQQQQLQQQQRRPRQQQPQQHGGKPQESSP